MESCPPNTVFAGINTCFKFAEFATRITEAGTENEVFVRTIQVVRVDLREVERLISVPSVQSKLILTPPKLEWVRAAIQNTKFALSEIGKWVERLKVDQQAYGAVKFETRVRWVFNDHEKLVNRQHELTACHQQLSNVLNYLVPLEGSPSIPPPPGYAQSMIFEDFLSPRQRRKTLSVSMAAAIPKVTETPHESANALSRGEDSILPAGRYPFEPTQQSYPAQSPPPAYTKATDLRHSSSELRRKPVYSTKHNFDSLGSTGHKDASLDSGYRGNFDNTHNEKQSVMAYNGNASQARTLPELESNNFTLRATNAVGPVDPFEMFASPDAESLQSVAGPTETLGGQCPGSYELPGDIYHPVELPAAVPPCHSPVNSQSLSHKSAGDLISPPSLLKYGSLSNDVCTQESVTLRRRDEPAGYPISYPAVGAAPSSFLSLPGIDRPTSAPAESHQLFEDTGSSVHQASPFERPALDQRSRTQVPDTYSSRRMQNQKHLLDMLGWLDE